MNKFTGVILGSMFGLFVIFTGTAHAAGTNCLNQSSAHGVVTVSGLTATAKFTIPNSCGAQQVSFVSYKAPSANGQPLSQQVVFHSTTQTLNPGTYQMQIQIPDCFYQVDLVRGTVITQFNGSTYHGENRWLAGKNAGTKVCESTSATTPPVTPTNTTPSVLPASTTLPNTGPGNALLVGLAATTFAGLLHYNRSKLQNLIIKK